MSKKLHSALSSLPLLDVMKALSPQSKYPDLSTKEDQFSYEKLEFLGDGVLKLLHTNGLLASKLSNMEYLHEGIVVFSIKKFMNICRRYCFYIKILEFLGDGMLKLLHTNELISLKLSNGIIYINRTNIHENIIFIPK